ncbi:chorismate synthase [Ignicoccus hospitalis]|uniref:Chorismate synthase n=1 Tax=Ignicoccus hospitalis (strain KIN4/I / DSM 18386 / JCM 14125) TaxID=453591 RepID=AROC_IGNH4|nr:chorismate synthase [Ignicoccus hospitalis]A8A9W1.1 RecName: Full=Chorismate synthase; Short=CS; AltName: Full=5-enolpyruvylshikimate-3-phosphate phospholyase [Ignicoccus hospitalis KIN4/I]ABU81713.1 chorismate synthase [Ignicoccus hospitalis KIN4/I]HIH89976.1 chorismate synthase [Desulfurococcaceae archaeon]
MGGNTIGKMFSVTTWGESHGKAIGAVIDGCPAGLPLSEEDLLVELSLRRPGRRFTTPRREPDVPEILSGVFNGKTTGMPISIIIRNRDVISSYYEKIKETPRPGHADLAYIKKYGYEHWDYRGGGRASGRETAARVAAGAVAKKLLGCLGVVVSGYVVELGGVEFPSAEDAEESLRSRLSPFRVLCCEEKAEEVLKEALERRDSVGGVVEAVAWNAPAGLGEPVFDKLKADLAKAMMSIPASVGFEVGWGFKLARLRGSEARDKIVSSAGEATVEGDKAGGMLGGISVGAPIRIRVAFKPTSSIMIPEKTVNIHTLEETEVEVPGRHDPAIVLRAVSVVESMFAIVLVDHAIRAGLLNPVRVEWGPHCQRVWELYADRVP